MTILLGILVACGGSALPETAAGAQEKEGFELLNSERVRCGFGSLRSSTVLAQAARAHARWSILNGNGKFSHNEDPAFPLEFTGVGVADRLIAQKYPLAPGARAGEVYAAFIGMPDDMGLGPSAVRLLLNAPYHLVYLTGTYREVGVSAQRPSDVGLSTGWDEVVMELAHTAAEGPQDLAQDVVATYPCDGSEGLVYSLSNESPNPISGRDLAKAPLGVSIVVRVRHGQTLNITSVSVVSKQSGSLVTMRPHVGGVNGAPDPHQDFDASVAYVVADAPMTPNTAYNAVIKGTNNGTDFVKQFTFTTGGLAFVAP